MPVPAPADHVPRASSRPRATPRSHRSGGRGGSSWWRGTDGRTASGLAAGGGGRLGWAFMHRAWAGPSPELSSPLESNRKVPGKQPQGAARARAWNKRDPSRARPSHPPSSPRTGGPQPSWAAPAARCRGQGPSHVEQCWVEFPPERRPGLRSDPHSH